MAERSAGSSATTTGRVEKCSSCRWLIAFLWLIVLPRFATAQDASPGESRPGDQFTVRVNVDSVVLHPTAESHQGVLVSGLGKGDFQVYENGVLQQITYFSHEDIPVAVGLVVDNSGSMRQKHPAIVTAALAFFRSSSTRDQLFVINFNERVGFGLPAGTAFTDKADQLAAALSKTPAEGLTALYDAIAAGLEHLKQSDHDKKVLIVMSDGGDNASKYNFGEIMSLVRQSDAIIYTLGLFDEEDPDRNPHVLKELAKATGGEAFLNVPLSDVVPLCERIAHDIRGQYTVAYTPTNPRRDGGYRAIQVKATKPGGGHVNVRARTGYYATFKTTTTADSQGAQP